MQCNETNRTRRTNAWGAFCEQNKRKCSSNTLAHTGAHSSKNTFGSLEYDLNLLRSEIYFQKPKSVFSQIYFSQSNSPFLNL